MLTGENPEVNAEVSERLRSLGHEDFVAYVAWACERALERGILPHTNLGVALPRGPGPAARRDRVAGADARVRQPRPRRPPGLADEAPGAAAGDDPLPPASCRIPFTSGILVGIGESEEDRMASLEALAAVHAEYGHIQEVILQNFVPHRRYYGEEPAEIATESGRGVLAHRRVGRPAPPTCPRGRARSRSRT